MSGSTQWGKHCALTIYIYVYIKRYFINSHLCSDILPAHHRKLHSSLPWSRRCHAHQEGGSAAHYKTTAHQQHHCGPTNDQRVQQQHHRRAAVASNLLHDGRNRKQRQQHHDGRRRQQHNCSGQPGARDLHNGTATDTDQCGWGAGGAHAARAGANHRGRRHAECADQ